MLKPLVDYSARHGLSAEKGFAPKPARWAVSFSAAGDLVGVIEIGDVENKKNKGREFPLAPELDMPELVSGGITKSHFLIDTADVVALFGPDTDDEKVQAKHAYFISLLQQASGIMPELAYAAEALADDEKLATIQATLEENKAKPTDKMTVRIDGAFPVESNAWHDWWREFRVALTADKSSKKKTTCQMPCFITGDIAEPVRTHGKVSGLADVGGQPAGSTMVSADKPAFASYNLKDMASCPISEEAATSYRNALNDLLSNHAQRIGEAKAVHWYATPIAKEDDPIDIFAGLDDEGQEIDAQKRATNLFQSIRTGSRPDLANNYYYAITMSGAGGRVMVRDWMEGQFEDLVANICTWFDDLSIVHRDGGLLAPAPKFFAVIGATVPEIEKNGRVVRDLEDAPPPFIASMWRTAINAQPIPRNALAQAVARIRIAIIKDYLFDHARMGLIKAYHVRQARMKGGCEMSQELKPYLNEAHPSPAYQCGRLMAVFAALQHAALGDVGAGVVQRYYAAASATPSLVLGRLTRSSQHHLNKLAGESGGLAHWYEERLGAIYSQLGDSIPRTLDLEGQSLFALGYYQQLVDLRTKKDKNDASTDNENSEGDQI